MKNDTIAAIATPPGTGGVAIVRISGPEAEKTLRSAFRRGDKKTEWKSHEFVYGHIVRGGETVDEGMAVLMRAPRSYTREDVAELHCHGGETVTRMTLEAALAAGARPAQPGEFTRRAFENGRVDLAQAEAVMRLIGAQGEAAARQARRQMDGAVSRGVEKARQKLLDMLAEIAACTDFPDEIEEAPTAAKLLDEAKTLSGALRAACDPRSARVLETGFNVVIAGRPNVGKSSLLNALLGEERAIVTSEAGTTRDAVRGAMELAGVRVNLTDTAGLREADSEAEKIGVKRAKKAVANADLALVVLDASQPLTEEDRETLAETESVNRWILLNKTDLPAAARLPAADMTISAQTGEGVETLRERLREEAKKAQGGGALLTQARHIDAAQRAAESLDAMCRTLESGTPLDFAAVDATDALRALGEITGEDAAETVVDAVFANFCVGK